ncbi:TPA: colicin-like pore-forming protein [Salmonella enterica subsp. enterica serovar Muenchen]|nr:colicin-like pore-forming protein [Salmonella enterica]
MSSKLSGYGHTAGESMGGTGANMNQQHGGSSGGGVHWGGGSGHGNSGGQHSHQGSSGKGTSTQMRPPTAADIAAQYNSFGGTQITASMVSNIRPDGFGGYLADIAGASHTVSSETGVETTNSVAGFTGVPVSTGKINIGNGGSGSGNSGFTWGGEVKSDSVDKAILDVNQKILDMQKQLPVLETTMKEKQERVAALKKIFRNHSYHGIRDAQRQYDEAMNKHRQLEDNISALKGSLSELEKQKDINEKEVLTKTSELITTMGDKVGEYLGVKYKTLAKEIADEIKNFQGKKIRSYDDAMASLNKITSNPAMKINQADRDALVNAWKHVDAQDMANKLENMSRAFKVADLVMKVEKIREKSIVGCDTGDWGPLILEVESWVLSGIAYSVVLSIFSATLGTALLSFGLPVTAVGIMGIIIAGVIGAVIDDKFADEINNEIIPSAH